MDFLVDWTTKLWKIVDHNPGLFIAIALSAVLVGCDSGWMLGRADSMLTGERSTGPEIRVAAEVALVELADAQAAIGLRIETSKRELETLLLVAGAELASVSEKIEVTVDRANEEIEAADVVTKRNAELIQGILTLTGSAIPGLGAAIPLLLAGGLGVDNLRTKRVVKRLKNGGSA